MVFKVSKDDRYKTGVYCIKNTLNNKIYIGSTSNNFYNRYHQHISDYKVGKREIRILYRAFDKYGIENFEFTIICICSKSDCIKMEQFYINNGTDYNCSMVAGSLLGMKHLPTSKTRTVIGGLHHCSKPIYQFKKNGDFVKKHNSMIEAVKTLSKTKNATSHLTQCCLGKVFSCYSYRWSFTEKIVDRVNRLGKCKVLIDNGDYKMQFDSQVEASEYIKSLGFKCWQGRIARGIKFKEKVYGFSIKKI